MAFSPDGTTLASGSFGDVKLSKSRTFRVTTVATIMAAMLELRPFPECGCIHWEDVIGDQHRTEPRFQFLRLGDILLTGEFDAT